MRERRARERTNRIGDPVRGKLELYRPPTKTQSISVCHAYERECRYTELALVTSRNLSSSTQFITYDAESERASETIDVTIVNQPLRGIIPPLVTPLLDQDELDHVGLERLIEYQIQGGVSGLFILGTTGEGPSLSYRLRYELMEKTCEAVAGRIPVLVGITDTSLVEAVVMAKHSLEVGATSVVAAAPYYFPVKQSEACHFLLELADHSPLPLFVYNIPPCVGYGLTLETIEELATHQNICGIKDSAGDMDAYKKILELRGVRPDWTFLMGPEQLTAESVLAGGDGAVTGGANLRPHLFVASYQAAVRRDHGAIERLQVEIDQLASVYQMAGHGMSGYLRGLKSALAAAELCSDQLAAPLQRAEEADRAKIAAFVHELAINTRQ